MESDNSNKKVEVMTNEELLTVFQAGCDWLDRRMQVLGTNKNVMGGLYDEVEFEVGLKRLEGIENELQKRGVNYGE